MTSILANEGAEKRRRDMLSAEEPANAPKRFTNMEKPTKGGF